jgi:hypothetical protein
MLHPSWPQVLFQAKCHQVKHEEENGRKSRKDKFEADFPVDKKYTEVRELLDEYKDIFHYELDTLDRLSGGLLDFKLKAGAKPYQTNRVQRVNYNEMSGCMKALQAHLDGGLLVEHNEEEHGPLEWLFYGQYIEKPAQPGYYRKVGYFRPLKFISYLYTI